jgi:hypothetical protein
MCDRAENAKSTEFDYHGVDALNMKERQGTARPGISRMSKDHVIELLHGAARDLETQAAGVRRLADIVNVAGEHEYPLFAALAAVVRK